MRGGARRKIALALLLALAGAASVIAPRGGSVEAASALRWEKDFKAAKSRARVEGRIIMVDFWAAWCTFCDKLDQTTYKDAAVVARLSRTTVAVKVNTEGRNDELELADEHAVESLPTIGFFTPEGRAVARIEGYVDAKAFLKLLTTAEVEGADMIGWEKTLRTEPNNFAALYGLGAKMYEQNYPDEARPLLERARRNDQGALRHRKRVRMLLGRLIEDQSSFTDAETMFREGLALPPDSDIDPRLRILLARALVNLGKKSEAQKELTRLIARYPNHPVTVTARKTLEALK
jgi:thioredoxin-related protein